MRSRRMPGSGAARAAAFAVGALRGEKLVEYVSALAVAPTAGADGLDLAVATAQLSAFSRWRLSAAAQAIERGRASATAARKRRRRSVEEEDANAAAAVDALKKRQEMLSKEEKLMSQAAELMSDCELM
ncbi:uncharacterized protein LOC106866073 isoform X2 [Brachypodium distachyon]|uniref:uncharacterized protein LOC106866073 isoform X2 n=1 Tax=Brachypodium distachyon TaxID=15368 RepID=UPI000D0DCA47|nr:uncharacterized protein LOC106866073 isoform X2 [Brachypodium distachyon]|eukprot:XP_024315512.1 uncharacterized protein LOC106866073 isoform X2 [Brachypodium distachyon]